jgi:hypothetical protein
MPTVATILTHWKSTAQGLLVFVVATCGVLTTSNIFSAKEASIISLVSSLAFAYIGIISKDSGVEVASVAGGPPKAVASHEVPEDPTAVPVTTAVPVKSKNVWGDTEDAVKGKN